uniref:U-box domain-containing protein n=1 Tax=Pyramimonas obovata TaxID=1411642 RepID=A0A7S0R6Z2_9CHLO|mmetsp:Transcript_27231/g.59475  ORF Transcript_27231/g.59475 Transcript_27231/m.59475 type:complete len:264 (+) Transcript_27231:153-944(+)
MTHRSLDHDPPRAMTCPITLDIMRDPVMDVFGHTFERAAVEAALQERSGVSPLTNKRYPRGAARLTPNYTVRQLINEYLEKVGKRRAEEEAAAKAKEDRIQAEARTAVARARAKEAKEARIQAEVAVAKACKWDDEAQAACKRAEEEEAEYRRAEASVTAVAAARQQVEEARRQAEMAAADARAASRRRAEAEAEVQKAKLERAVIEEKKMKEALLQHLEAESRKEYALFSDDENVADLDAQARRMAKMAELARKELGIVEDQ